MTKDEIIECLKVEFPQSLEKCEIVSITPRGALEIITLMNVIYVQVVRYRGRP